MKNAFPGSNIVHQPPSIQQQHPTFLGFDWGTHRIGVAVGSTLLLRSTPVTVLKVLKSGIHFKGIAELVTTWQPSALIVGFPRYPASGEPARNAVFVEEFANTLRERFALPVTLVDERYSSLSAARYLPEIKTSSKKRRGSVSAKHRRYLSGEVASVALDARAAAIILDQYLSDLP